MREMDEKLKATILHHCKMWRWIADETVRQKRRVEKREYFKHRGVAPGDIPAIECYFCDGYGCKWKEGKDHCLLAGDLSRLCFADEKETSIFNLWNTEKDWLRSAFLALEMCEAVERWAANA